MNEERFVSPKILQLVLGVSPASSYRLAHELGAVKIGSLKTIRTPLSAVKAKLGNQVANAVENELNRAILQRYEMGLAEVEPLSAEQWAAVELRAAEWRKERGARGFGRAAEQPEEADVMTATVSVNP